MVPYQVGDMAVCISDDWEDDRGRPVHDPNIPRKGIIYTIRDITPYFTGVYLRFVELVNPQVSRSEPFYNSVAFRPVQKPSIECFRKLLKPIKELV